VRIRVKWFAGLREEMGSRETEIDLKSGSTLQDLIDLMLERHAALLRYAPSLHYAVNRRYATLQAVLRDGDEVAFLPPVGGG
jgi:molybdopterin converting factor subunit 1